MTKEELIEGEIYYGKDSQTDVIFKPNNCEIYGNKDFYNGNYPDYLKELRKATLEEKYWLNECIKANKFISYEEAMKTFIPEYVECIEENVYDYGTNVIGKIYKVFGVTPNHINPYYLIEYGGIKYLSVSKHRFKPSTKEAYEAQFKQYPLTKEECYSSEIEIGDEVQVLCVNSHNSQSNWYKIGNSFERKDIGIIVTILDYNDVDGGAYKVQSPKGITALRKKAIKLHKKASQTTNSIKKVNCVSPTKVNTNITVKQPVKLTSNVIINIKPINNNVKVHINEQKYQAKKVIISKTTIKI